MTTVQSRTQKLPYSKICNIEDFTNSELTPTLSEVYKMYPYLSGEQINEQHFLHRKYWEVAMAVRALRRFGVLHRKARILGIGAGTEPTLFYLTRFVEQVFATDLYADTSVAWAVEAPPVMLVDPSSVAPIPFERNRLVVQHMNGCELNYPDNFFDGIFSSSSIEHFGSLENVRKAAAEMGRVLKPGGIATLATEFCIDPKPTGNGWEGVLMFNSETLKQFVIAPSKLELTDTLDVAISESSCQKIVSLADATMKNGLDDSLYPHIVLSFEGYQFTSIFLVMRKAHRFQSSIRKLRHRLAQSRYSPIRSGVLLQ